MNAFQVSHHLNKSKWPWTKLLDWTRFTYSWWKEFRNHDKSKSQNVETIWPQKIRKGKEIKVYWSRVFALLSDWIPILLDNVFNSVYIHIVFSIIYNQEWVTQWPVFVNTFITVFMSILIFPSFLFIRPRVMIGLPWVTDCFWNIMG